jgi:hypothetical protein
MTRRSALLTGCLALGIAECLLYSVNFQKFFQGDALFWTRYRFHGVGEFLRALPTLDVAHWYRRYRTESSRAFLSIVRSGAIPYHLVVFLSFLKLSCLVFLFFYYLTRNMAIAFIGAFYFGIHSINVYPTYDFAFSPEVFYVFFYVSSVWLFIEAERRQSWIWRVASAAVFALSLMSKEAAVSLPAMLLLSHLVWIRTGLQRALGAVAIHGGILLVYMVYIVAILKVGTGSYMLGIHNVPHNLVSAAYYVFNFRVDGFAPTRNAPGFVMAFLGIFALFQIVLSVMVARRQENKLLIFGLCWFVIGLGPMLFLNVFGRTTPCLP